MSNQKVYCEDLQNFAEMIALFVKQGLTFNAYADKLLIELTGGY